MKTSTIIKRIGAFLVDSLVVLLISSALINIPFLNPKYEEYLATNEEYITALDKYSKEEITIEEFNDQAMNLSYKLNRYGYVYNIGNIVITILYFGVFPLATKGQTLGKKLFGLKMVSVKDKELKFYNYLIRTIILNGLIFEIVNLIALLFKEKVYLNIYTISSNLNQIIAIVIFLMILFYKDNRGLHDILASSKVIDLKREEEKQDIEVIKPKKKNNKKEEE